MSNKNAIPPIRNKYNFQTMEIGDTKEIKENYRLVRVASTTYSNKHNVKIIALNNNNGTVTIKRIK